MLEKLMMERRARYTSTRPRTSVVEDPRAWWMHSISSVISDLQGRRSTFSWARCAALLLLVSCRTRHAQTQTCTGSGRIKARRNLRKDYLERYRAVVIETHPELNVIRWLEEVRGSRRVG